MGQGSCLSFTICKVYLTWAGNNIMKNRKKGVAMCEEKNECRGDEFMLSSQLTLKVLNF